MAKIVYEDGTEKDFNEEDFISREELSEKYLSKEDVENNYVSKEKYDQKKKQTKEAFKQLDLAKKEGVEADKEAMEKSLRDEITFTTKHWFEEIPEEIKTVKTKYPDLSWEQAYKISDYQEQTYFYTASSG